MTDAEITAKAAELCGIGPKEYFDPLTSLDDAALVEKAAMKHLGPSGMLKVATTLMDFCVRDPKQPVIFADARTRTLAALRAAGMIGG